MSEDEENAVQDALDRWGKNGVAETVEFGAGHKEQQQQEQQPHKSQQHQMVAILVRR